MSKTSLIVLNMLANGDFQSGELIGQKLGISRMAVSKAIKGLNERGINITSVPGKGYRLEGPLQLLDKDAIRARLDTGGYSDFQIDILHDIDSTSDYLLQQSRVRDVNRTVCLAENQNSGRGRRHRQWHASPYRNITLSIGWRFEDGMSALSGLGIAAGITIAKTLHEAGLDRNIGLKWPNDIIWKESKLGGLLIDVRGEHDGPCLVVLGLGLNLSLSVQDQQAIDQACTSLEQISGIVVDRNALVADMIHALANLFEGYSASGFDSFHHLWTDYDRLHGREVNVIRGEKIFTGLAMGIDEFGALLVDEGKGSFSRFLSGDVSLRLAR